MMAATLRPKVLFCTDGIFPHTIGGIQRHSRLLIEALAQTGEVDLVVIHPHAGIQVFDPSLGIKEEIVPAMPGKRQYLLEKYDYSKAVRAVAERYPDHLLYAQGLTVWNGLKSLRKRLIFNPHGLEPFQPLSRKDWLRGAPFRLIFARLFRNAAYTVSLGGRLSDILRRYVPQGHLQVLPNAINLPDIAPDTLLRTGAPKPLRCLFVGRFAFNKGIDVLMDAIGQLEGVPEMENFTFTLAGKGPLYEHYRSLPPNPRVTFLGFVPDEDLFELYRTHDLFILPTLFEGMPTVVLEAMSYGMAVLVTDVGATRELVDATNGLIIKRGNPDSLVKALQVMAAASPEQWKAFSQASLARVRERFTWTQVANQHIELFRTLKA